MNLSLVLLYIHLGLIPDLCFIANILFDATNIFSRSATDFGAGKKKGRAQMCVKWIVRGWRQIL